MDLKEQLNGEIKIGKVMINEDGEFTIQKHDKDGNHIETETMQDVLGKFIGKEFVRVRIDYLKEF